jgi:hypothetical protein
MEELDLVKEQLARLPTRKDLARTALMISFTAAALVIIWFETFWRYCLRTNREPSAMYGSELRTYGP